MGKRVKIGALAPSANVLRDGMFKKLRKTKIIDGDKNNNNAYIAKNLIIDFTDRIETVKLSEK